MKLILCLLGAMLLVSCREHATPEMLLAENGRASAVIVLPDEPAPAEITAAQELKHYLEAVSGASFEITAESSGPSSGRILVGQTTRFAAFRERGSGDFLGPEDFIIRTTAEENGSDLLLAGGSPRGTLYAVYSFLEEDLGCRWLSWYGDEFVPDRKTIRAGALDRVESPAMPVRDIVVHTNRISDLNEMKKFLVRNRCQGPELNFFGDMAPYGGTSHSYGRRVIHTFFYWIPPAKYFESNPGFFSYSEGKRIAQQLCFSDPELRSTLTRKILEEIGEFGGAGNFSVSAQDDHGGALCECPDCRELVDREGTPGAPLFDYLAEAGQTVAREFPDAFLTTAAYRRSQTEIPPRTIELPDNVIIIFAPIDANFAASLEHPDNADTLENLVRWSEITRRLWVWYYPNTYGAAAFPMGNLTRIADDFRLFKRIGVEGYFVEQDAAGVYDSRRLADLQTWLIAKLMWEPDREMDTLILDFTEHYYGPAAPFIRMYIEALEKATTAMDRRISWRPTIWQHDYLSSDFLLKAQGIFDRAEDAAVDNREFLDRVSYARMSLDLACILLWQQFADEEEVPFTRPEIIQRYRETYARAVIARALPARQESLLETMEAMLRAHPAETPPPPRIQIPEINFAGGNFAEVDWGRSKRLPGGWYLQESAEHSKRKFGASIAHDGTFLYIKLQDYCDTASLIARSSVFPYDCWELFVTKQTNEPGVSYRHFALGAGGDIAALYYDEAEGGRLETIAEHNASVVSNTEAPGLWTAYFTIPLDELTKHGVRAGEEFQMNIFRVSSPAIAESTVLSVDSWVSYSTLHDVNRMAEFILENRD